MVGRSTTGILRIARNDVAARQRALYWALVKRRAFQLLTEARDKRRYYGENPGERDEAGKFSAGGGGGGDGAGASPAPSGKIPETGPERLAASLERHKAIRTRIDKVAKQTGYDPAKITLSNDTHTFTLNGQERKAAGTFDRTKPDVPITMYVNQLGVFGDQIEAVAVHEIGHAKWQNALDRYDKERVAIANMPKPPPNPDAENLWERQGGWQAVQKPDGSLREPYDKQFPAYNAMYSLYFGPGSRDGLAESDGVTQYSYEYWQQWQERGKKPEDFEIAVNETLAEMRMKRFQEGRLPEPFGERILSYRGKDPKTGDWLPPPSKEQMAANAKRWRDLFVAVNKVWKLPA